MPQASDWLMFASLKVYILYELRAKVFRRSNPLEILACVQGSNWHKLADMGLVLGNNAH